MMWEQSLPECLAGRVVALMIIWYLLAGWNARKKRARVVQF
jgi:hypothetical protein